MGGRAGVGDERAIALQLQRQHEAIELIKRRNEEAPRDLDDNDTWDVLEALNTTRLEAGRPPLFEADEERDISK